MTGHGGRQRVALRWLLGLGYIAAGILHFIFPEALIGITPVWVPNHMMIDMARDPPQLGWGYHVPRMLLQPLLIWLTLWVSHEREGATERPIGRA